MSKRKQQNEKPKALARFFHKIFVFISNEVREIRLWLHKYGEAAVDIVEKIKTWVDNPALDIAVELTATKWDDRALDAIRYALKHLLEVNLKGQATDKLILDLMKQLKEPGLSKEMKKALLFKLAGLIARGLAQHDNEDMSPSEADFIVQSAYIAKTNRVNI